MVKTRKHDKNNWVFTIYKKFPESAVGKKIEHRVLRRSSEKLLEGRERLKRFSHYYFFGKWNLFVQMLKAIPGQNSPTLNFAYDLPKFGNRPVCKQPVLTGKLSEGLMDNDWFWISYTGVANVVLHASRGKRLLVEEWNPSRDTAAISFYGTPFLWHHLEGYGKQQHRGKHERCSLPHCGGLWKEKHVRISIRLFHFDFVY